MSLLLRRCKLHIWIMMVISRPALVKPVSIAPLVTFRIAFGLLMFLSTLRFLWRGWVDAVYVKPTFHFTYMGFDWVQPFSKVGMYILFFTVALSALFIALGLFYRAASILFFVGFTYIELIDVTTYLNHYYFVSLIAFLMIWLPANRLYSIDTEINLQKKQTHVPSWTIWIIRFQLAVVYIFAGLAKLNADWLFNAEPMKTWLPSKSHLPIVGKFMYEEWVAYLFSWFGALYDLFIVFLLLNRKTRTTGFFLVLVFHTATAIFFPGIGMFPYVMMVSSLIFFSGDFHEKLLSYLFGRPRSGFPTIYNSRGHTKHSYHYVIYPVILVYIFLQIIIPLRFLFYPGHLFWTEEGYRFSWRVMLMEKAGTAYFTVKDKTDSKSFAINNAEYLTPLQEKMMSTQPDMILRFAHFLADKYQEKGIDQPKVYAEVYVALNGERSRLFIDSTVNLAAERLSWKHYHWILPYKK